jgi:hypothetical protein
MLFGFHSQVIPSPTNPGMGEQQTEIHFVHPEAVGVFAAIWACAPLIAKMVPVVVRIWAEEEKKERGRGSADVEGGSSLRV